MAATPRGEDIKITVAGGTGFIGSKIVKKLLDSGNQVVVLTRKARKSGIKNLEYLKWDAKPKGLDISSAMDADVVINLGGGSLVKRWTKEEKKRIVESRIDSTRAIVEAIAKSERKPKLLINASAIGYYGDRGEKEIAETENAGKGFLAGVCKKWEREANKAGKQTRVCTLRTGTVLGDGGFLKMLRIMLSFGISPYPSKSRQWISWIHIDDLVELMIFIIGDKRVNGAVNAVSPNPVRSGTFIRAVEKATGSRHLISMPAIVSKIAAGELAEEILLSSQRVVPEKAARHGFGFSYGDINRAMKDIANSCP